MASYCPQVLHFCTVRVTRLDETTGAVVGGAQGAYVTNAQISLELSPEIEEGTESTLKNGCGATLASTKTEDRLKRWNLTLTGGEFEPGLIEIMTGHSVVTDGGDTVGVKGVDQLDPDYVPNVCAFEGWATANDGDRPNSTRPFYYVVFPASTWQIGDHTLQEEFATFPLTGFSRTNDQWGSGPYGDDTGLSELVETWMFATVQEDPPEAACAYVAVTPGS